VSRRPRPRMTWRWGQLCYRMWQGCPPSICGSAHALSTAKAAWAACSCPARHHLHRAGWQPQAWAQRMAGRTRRLDGQKRPMTMTYGAFLLLFLVTPIAVLRRRRAALPPAVAALHAARRGPAAARPVLAPGTTPPPSEACGRVHRAAPGARAGGPCRRRSTSFACSKRCPKPRTTPLPVQAPVAGCAIRLPRDFTRKGYVAAHTGWRLRHAEAGARCWRLRRPAYPSYQRPCGRSRTAHYTRASVWPGISPCPPICRRSSVTHGPAQR
jgi:hypothetical protein